MSRYSAILDIQSIAATLSQGESHRGVCPLCNGGSSHEKSLAITRSGPTTASFICFRNNCSLNSGHIAIFSNDGKVLSAKSRPISREIKEPSLYPLSEDAISLLRNKYTLDNSMIRHSGVRLTFDKRLAFPLMGPYGRSSGLVIRKEKELYSGTREYSTIPKVWNFVRDKDMYCGSWYQQYFHKRKYSNTLILVEDIISSLRITPYADAVALTGTNLLRPILDEILHRRYDRVYIALDNDAIDKAFSLMRRLKSTISNLLILPLEQDIKNMSNSNLNSTLVNYKVIQNAD